MRPSHKSLFIALTLAAFACPAARAATAPSDPCSLLPGPDAAKAVGHAVGAPDKTGAPRPYKNTAQGTDCLYHAKGERGSLLFRVYFDGSSAESAELFKRLSAFYGESTPARGVGDEAYMDSNHALHARKGNVRFYLEVSGTSATAAAKDKVLTGIGTGISGRL